MAGSSHDAALTRGVDCAMPAVTAPNRRVGVAGSHYAGATRGAVRLGTGQEPRVSPWHSSCYPVMQVLKAEHRIEGNEADSRL